MMSEAISRIFAAVRWIGALAVVAGVNVINHKPWLQRSWRLFATKLYMTVYPPHRNPSRHTVYRPLRISRQVQPLAQRDLRNEQEDRHGRQPAPSLGFRGHGPALRIQPSLGHQQARPTAAVNEPQSQPRAAFPFAGGYATAFRALARSWRGDRQPEPIL